MFNKKFLFGFTILFFMISFVSTLPSDEGSPINHEINYSLIPTVNNSQYLQGYTPTTLRGWMQNTFDTIYCQLTGCIMTGNLETSGNITADCLTATSGSFTSLYVDGGAIIEDGISTIAGNFDHVLISDYLKLYDNDWAYFGTSSNAKIGYNGNDFIVNPKVVGSGDFIVDGDLVGGLDENEPQEMVGFASDFTGYGRRSTPYLIPTAFDRLMYMDLKGGSITSDKTPLGAGSSTLSNIVDGGGNYVYFDSTDVPINVTINLEKDHLYNRDFFIYFHPSYAPKDFEVRFYNSSGSLLGSDHQTDWSRYQGTYVYPGTHNALYGTRKIDIIINEVNAGSYTYLWEVSWTNYNYASLFENSLNRLGGTMYGNIESDYNISAKDIEVETISITDVATIGILDTTDYFPDKITFTANKYLVMGTFPTLSYLYHDGSNLLIRPGYTGSSSLRIGDLSNYTEIKEDGEVNLHGTAKVKKTVLLDWYTASMGSGGEQYVYGRDADDNATEYNIWEGYIPLDFESGTNVTFRFKWTPTIDQTGGDQKVIKLRLLNNKIEGEGSVIGSYNNNAWTTTLATNEAKRTVHIEERTITGLSAGDGVSFRVDRYGADGADTLVGDAFFFLSAELEYTSNKLGEAT